MCQVWAWALHCVMPRYLTALWQSTEENTPCNMVVLSLCAVNRVMNTGSRAQSTCVRTTTFSTQLCPELMERC